MDEQGGRVAVAVVDAVEGRGVVASVETSRQDKLYVSGGRGAGANRLQAVGILAFIEPFISGCQAFSSAYLISPLQPRGRSLTRAGRLY